MTAITYIWRIASDCPNDLIVSHDKETVDATALRKAVPLKNGRTFIFTHKGSVADLQSQSYFPNSASLPLVSENVANRLLKLKGVQVEALPSKVLCSDGHLDVVLLNPLVTVRAVDWTESDVVFIPGTKQIMKFNRLRLLPAATAGVPLARLDEYRSFVLASQEVKNIFSSSPLCEFDLDSTITP